MIFQTIVVLPADSLDAEEAITRLMAPYDMERSVAAHKEYVPQQEFDCMVKRYADTGLIHGHDEGGFWWMSSDNPLGRWDGWTLWSFEDDSWPTTAALPERLVPAAILTPDGVWHDLATQWEMSDEQTHEVRTQAAQLLTQYPSHRAVVQDCHR